MAARIAITGSMDWPRHHPTGFGVLRVTLGVVLLAAATTKGYVLATEPIAATSIFTSRWFLFGLVQFELVLGLWLISGLHPRWAWGAALATFGAFGLFSLHSALSGAESCGCFGSLTVSPWITTSFNVLAIAALLMFRPRRSAAGAADGFYRRKLALFSATAVLLGVPGGFMMAGGLPTIGQPRGLVADSYSHNFGSLTPEHAGHNEHVFVLRNTSDQPIRIIDTSSSCGCTVPEVSDNPIPPGGTVEIPVKADWAGRAGAQAAEVQLTTDSPATPRVRLAVRGNVLVTALVSRNSIGFGTLQPGESKTRIVEVVPGTDRRPFRIVGVSSTSEHVSVSRVGSDDELTDEPLAGDPGRFAVTITAPRYSAREESTVVFLTDLPYTPELKLAISTRFAGALTAQPPSLFFSGADADPELKQVVILSSGSDVSPIPSAEIIWESEGPNPFFIQEIETASESDPVHLAVLNIGFDKKEVKTWAVHRAILRVTVGRDEVNVSLLAMPVAARNDL